MNYRLKYWRTMRALSQEALAKKAHCGTATLVRIEKGLEPTPLVVRKLVKALKIRIEDFVVDGPAPEMNSQL